MKVKAGAINNYARQQGLLAVPGKPGGAATRLGRAVQRGVAGSAL